MKKLILAAAALLCATVLTVQAEDAAVKKHAKKELTPEQKQLQTDMLTKYDADKNGKLDEKEKAAMSEADKAAWAKAFPPHAKKKDK